MSEFIAPGYIPPTNLIGCTEQLALVASHKVNSRDTRMKATRARTIARPSDGEIALVGDLARLFTGGHFDEVVPTTASLQTALPTRSKEANKARERIMNAIYMTLPTLLGMVEWDQGLIDTVVFESQCGKRYRQTMEDIENWYLHVFSERGKTIESLGLRVGPSRGSTLLLPPSNIVTAIVVGLYDHLRGSHRESMTSVGGRRLVPAAAAPRRRSDPDVEALAVTSVGLLSVMAEPDELSPRLRTGLETIVPHLSATVQDRGVLKVTKNQPQTKLTAIHLSMIRTITDLFVAGAFDRQHPTYHGLRRMFPENNLEADMVIDVVSSVLHVSFTCLAELVQYNAGSAPYRGADCQRRSTSSTRYLMNWYNQVMGPANAGRTVDSLGLEIIWFRGSHLIAPPPSVCTALMLDFYDYIDKLQTQSVNQPLVDAPDTNRGNQSTHLDRSFPQDSI